MLTVTDYRGQRQTLLPVREINLKACAPVILKQFILPGLGIEPCPADNRFSLSAHCANEPQRQDDSHRVKSQRIMTSFRYVPYVARVALDRNPA